jgi:hypothetical protein
MYSKSAHVRSGRCVVRIYLKWKTCLLWKNITCTLLYRMNDSKAYGSTQRWGTNYFQTPSPTKCWQSNHFSSDILNVQLSSVSLIGLLVEVGLRAQNAIWNFRVPCDIISNTFKVKIFFLVAFLSQHLNYSVIIIWKSLITFAIKNINTFHNIGR